jgi:hypothetical protein
MSSKPLFIPHVGIEEVPASNLTKDMCESTFKDECMGYDTVTGKGFSAKAMNPQNVKVHFYNDASQGTQFNHESGFQTVCKALQGQVIDKEYCNLTQQQLQSAVATVYPQGSVAKFNGAMLDEDDDDINENFYVRMLKALVLITLLIVILRCVSRLK